MNLSLQGLSGRLRFVLILSGLSCLSSFSVQAADWLTGPERDFFESMGYDVRLDGKTVRKPVDASRWPEIAQQASPPLRGWINTISDSMKRSTVTPEEKAKLAQIMQDGQKEVQNQMRGVLIGALLGEDSGDAAVRATNGVMKNGKIVDAWKLQREWLERGLDARKDADEALAKITGRFESRVGKQRSASDLPLSLVIEDKELRVSGKAVNGAIDSPIIQLKLFKNSTKGQWTGLNVLSGLAVQSMGVNEMNAGAQGEGARLSVAQERSMNLPLISTMLLPDVPKDGRISLVLSIPTRSALGLERVEARVWTGEGWFSVSNLPGLDEAKGTATKLVEEDRQRALAARQARLATPFGRPQQQTRGFTPRSTMPAPTRRVPSPLPGRRPGAPAQRPAPSPSKSKTTLSDDKLAISALNQAKLYLKDNKPDGARPYLEKAIKLAPSSSSATEAQRLIDELEK